MSEFVNKVYDRYLNKDFSYGQDNLNPVREISFEKTEIIEDLLGEIKDKVTEIDNRYSDLEEAPPNSLFNTGSGFNGDPSCYTKAKQNAGGDIMIFPSIDTEEDALLGEVQQLILKIAAITGIDESDKDLQDLDRIYCAGSFDLISGEEIESGIENYKSALFEKEVSSAQGSDSSSNNGEQENEEEEENEENETKEDTSTENESEEDLEEKEETQKYIASKIEIPENVKECAKADLALLKVILNILKVISTIKRILNPTLNIVVEIVEIITLAAQVWHNPPALAEIIQKLVNKIISILCMIISMLLQMLWDLLGLDCISEETVDLLDQIRNTLAGVNSIFAEVDKSAICLSSDIKEAIDASAYATKAVIESFKSLPKWDEVQDYFDFKKAGTDWLDNWKRNYASYGKAAAAEILEQSHLREKISDITVKVEEIGDTWKQMTQTVSQTGTSVDVQRLLSSFRDLDIV